MACTKFNDSFNNCSICFCLHYNTVTHFEIKFVIYESICYKWILRVTSCTSFFVNSKLLQLHSFITADMVVVGGEVASIIVLLKVVCRKLRLQIHKIKSFFSKSLHAMLHKSAFRLYTSASD